MVALGKVVPTARLKARVLGCSARKDGVTGPTGTLWWVSAARTPTDIARKLKGSASVHPAARKADSSWIRVPTKTKLIGSWLTPISPSV